MKFLKYLLPVGFHIGILPLAHGDENTVSKHSDSKKVDPAKLFEVSPNVGRAKVNEETHYVETREKKIMIKGVEATLIEVENQRFIIKGQNTEPLASELLQCESFNQNPNNNALTAEYKINKRSRVYLSALKQSCDPKTQNVRVEYSDKDVEVGVKWKGNGPNDKEKKIYANPVDKKVGVGVSF